MTTPQQFTPGDIVYLKSGSPKLTVLQSFEYNHYTQVGWFRYSDNRYETANIPTVALSPVNEKLKDHDTNEIDNNIPF